MNDPVGFDGDGHDNIWQFLALPVPPGGPIAKAEREAWEAQCKQLGKDAPRVFLQALKKADEAEQYAALLGLRLYGFEVWGEGYGPDFFYKLRFPGEKQWKIIKPLRPRSLP